MNEIFIVFKDDTRVWTRLEATKDALQRFCMDRLLEGYFDELTQTERALERLKGFILTRANFLNLLQVLLDADFLSFSSERDFISWLKA
jgi:hypothetical protein